MEKGYLTVETRTNFQALPVEEVCVKITSGGGTPFAQLETDGSGQTAPLELPAALRELSLDPEYQGRPYSAYDVEASAEGYETVHIQSVHIFSGEGTHVQVTMLPRIGLGNADAGMTVQVGEHGVQRKNLREQKGPLIAPMALRNVIIPDLMTVKLGEAGSDADTVQVTFPEYVKNVASNEIYPTWPAAAIEANVYAIITFALNRVYTRWYRSQGFYFDITNSASNDQLYVHGAPVYNSISVIVDKIFNRYVRRSGQSTPFFTSFWNGITSKYTGLSQWGTVTLASSGLTPLEILHYYYPNDMELGRTNTFSARIEPNPQLPLRLDCQGDEVRRLQRKLAVIRGNYPVIDEIVDEEGVFGETTRQAVRVFQRIFGLPLDGIAGTATWYKISHIYLAVSALNTLTCKGEILDIGTNVPGVTLRKGAAGVDVVTLQFILSYAAAFFPTVPAVTQNGIFVEDTAGAVKSFQRLSGLSEDGVVGKNTWQALYNAYHGMKENSAIAAGERITYTVQAGDTILLLAQMFGTTPEEIKRNNNLARDVLHVGDKLKIPAGDSVGETFVHIVVEEDTIHLLAQAFGTTAQSIRQLNNLTGDELIVGQELRIFGKQPHWRRQTPETPEAPRSFIYTVTPGDTLQNLAERFGATAENIRAMNDTDGDTINIGQQLILPENVNRYIVQPGDSLYLIARRFGVKISDLVKANDITGSTIYIGQCLAVPEQGVI